MPLNAEQRAAINRQNARKSTGPKTDVGKANSRRNATRHGLRAEVLALPNEDPEVVAARSEAWNDYYRPRSPAAQHLVNACVAATLLSDRCGRYHDAALSEQIRGAEQAWDERRDDEVEAHKGRLRTDPETAARLLKRTGAGCLWMIERWGRLSDALDAAGSWAEDDCAEAIRLMGFRPGNDTLRESPEAWLTRFLNLLCLPDAPAEQIDWYCDPRVRPETHCLIYRADLYPDPDDCLAILKKMVAEELQRLHAIADRLIETVDIPSRAGAADRASILHDGPSARLFLRYHSEARNAFHRAHGALIKALDRDAAEAETETETETDFSPPAVISPNEASVAPAPEGPPAPAAAVSPNEASPADAPATTSQDIESSATPSASRPARKRGRAKAAPVVDRAPDDQAGGLTASLS